jgi:hypothetical protein
MHGAGFQGRWEVMKVLKEFGLNELDVHQDGFTPFHRACWGTKPRHTDLVRHMVNDLGVDINLKATPAEDMARQTGLTCRTMTNNQETLAFLDIAEAADAVKKSEL